MHDFFRTIVVNMGIVTGTIAYFSKRKTWYLIMPLFILFLLLLPLKMVAWFTGLPYDILMFIHQARQEKLEQKMEAEGKDLYPLW